jgi:hypothetical protein
MSRRVFLSLLLLCAALKAGAQEFINLTSEEVRIDSVLPICSYHFPIGNGYVDSTYSILIEYPEFIDMSEADIRRYEAISDGQQLPPLPEVYQYIGVSRRQGTLTASFVPLVFRDGKYQKLVSFKLGMRSEKSGVNHSARQLKAPNTSQPSTYAPHSVLSTGRWAKISVTETGVYQLTEQLVRSAGFSSLDRVRIYGYGGALQPEVLNSSYLSSTDDLQEVATCLIGGRRLFHAVGPVGWNSATSTERTRNPYSDVGCYFITESDESPLTVDSAQFVSSFYPTNNDYHSLHEVDNFAWYHSGRNLYEGTTLSHDSYSSYVLAAHTDSGRLTIVLTSDGQAAVTVMVNDSIVGTVTISETLPSQSKAVQKTQSFQLSSLRNGDNTIALRQTSGGASVRLDYLALTMPTAAPAPKLSSDKFPVPQFVYGITNQDHHADTAVDMVIIIPTTQKLLAQAERLKQLHEERDSLRVRIVPADELFNEFSSGTPDANAYRRYLKMLYDRAESEDDMPRYLLLFGDGAWDNRMLTSDWRQSSPDDYLLCYESENSFSETQSYVCDEFFCMLDDGEGASLTKRDRTDVGVGRLPARSEAEAKIMVDKIIDYATNAHAGDWQNVLCFMGDDGNGNVHMREAEAAVKTVVSDHSSFNIRKVYWDAYELTSSSTGKRYPDVTRLLRQQMKQGALIMDYCGHGSPYTVSHERVLNLSDFSEATSLRLPLWVTASCDIMPFDTQEENIGETAMLNPRGGAIAFFGTTRTVYTGDNQNMNCSFLKFVLGSTNGRHNTLGDAVRLSKNDVRSIGDVPGDHSRSESYPLNKLHYSLLGDPALTLAFPSTGVVIDSINGQPVGNGNNIQLPVGQQATVVGHVETSQLSSRSTEPFNGLVSLTVKDVEQSITCRLNNTGNDGAETAFTFLDRPATIFNGQDSVCNGRFRLTFVVPTDISYSDGNGSMTAFVIDDTRQKMAHGNTEAFSMVSTDLSANDGIGPSIYCYLNSTAFQNGGKVNTTPYFFAQMTDKDGINVSGNGLGHDLQLTIDGDPGLTYTLNDYFQYDFGDYQSGSVGYSLPSLSEGEHRLTFRAWDVLNNSSVAELVFEVVRGLEPHCFSVECTKNPATTSTSFIINHDRTGSEMDVALEVFDTSGRLLWAKQETGVSTDNTYTLDWDLTTNSGSRLQTGVYLYRVLVSNDGSSKASKAQKLIILRK